MQTGEISELNFTDWQRVNVYLSDCGCGFGSFFLIAFILGYSSYLLIRSLPLWGHLLFFFGFSLLSAALGKIIGILYYRCKAILLLTKWSNPH